MLWRVTRYADHGMIEQMLRAIWWLVVILFLATRVEAQTPDDGALRRAVVKVWATQSPLNLSNPWQRSDGRGFPAASLS